MAQSEMLLQNLMRIITPNEIEQLTTLNGNQKKLSLTKMLCEQLNLFVKNKNQKDLSDEVEITIQTKSEIKSKSEIKPTIKDDDTQETEDNAPIENEKVDTLAFILKEQNNFKEKSNQLQKKDIFNSYQKTSSISVLKSNKSKNTKKTDDQKSNHLKYGNSILINKKFG